MEESRPSGSGAREAWRESLRGELQKRRQESRLRQLRQVEGGTGTEVTLQDDASGRTTYLQFCTNNYLGLAGDPEVVEASREAAARWGAGAGASRLVAGSLAIHHELEEALARFKGAEA